MIPISFLIGNLSNKVAYSKTLGQNDYRTFPKGNYFFTHCGVSPNSGGGIATKRILPSPISSSSSSHVQKPGLEIPLVCNRDGLLVVLPSLGGFQLRKLQDGEVVVYQTMQSGLSQQQKNSCTLASVLFVLSDLTYYFRNVSFIVWLALVFFVQNGPNFIPSLFVSFLF